MKYMGNYYHGLDTDSLKRLRSAKHSRIEKLKGDAGGYFHKKELATLREQISWIDAVILSRTQQPFLL